MASKLDRQLLKQFNALRGPRRENLTTWTLIDRATSVSYVIETHAMANVLTAIKKAVRLPKEVSPLTVMRGLADAARQIQNEERVFKGQLATDKIQ